eukprot:Sdes_comp14786_c0_seq1m3570
MLRFSTIDVSQDASQTEKKKHESSKEKVEELLISKYHEALKLQAYGSFEESQNLYRDIIHSESLRNFVPEKDSSIETSTLLWLKFVCLKNLGKIFQTQQSYK